jgi:hypothetical protein
MGTKIKKDKKPPILEFQTKDSGSKTYWLNIRFNPDNEPVDLFNGLIGLGWEKEEFGIPPWKDDDGYIEVNYTKFGTAIFAGWTMSEHKKNISSVKKLLKHFGLSCHSRKLTLAEMM